MISIYINEIKIKYLTEKNSFIFIEKISLKNKINEDISLSLTDNYN